mmetsp:Transcript_31429/g.78907  ORF Transcript_31429/g.78907 Transcript_31429/m.78907 type:complete len:419 (+) Transcript_31429:229-1485(+)
MGFLFLLTFGYMHIQPSVSGELFRMAFPIHATSADRPEGLSYQTQPTSARSVGIASGVVTSRSPPVLFSVERMHVGRDGTPEEQRVPSGFLSCPTGNITFHKKTLSHPLPCFISIHRLSQQRPRLFAKWLPSQRPLDVCLHALLQRIARRVAADDLAVAPHQELGVVPRNLSLEGLLLQEGVHWSDGGGGGDVVDQRRREHGVWIVFELLVGRWIHPLALARLVFDCNLVHHREFEAELTPRVLALLLAGPGCLAPELVCGKCHQLKPGIVILLVKHPESRVVGVLQGSLGGDVEDDGDVTLERAEVEGLAVLLHCVVVEARLDSVGGGAGSDDSGESDERGGRAQRYTAGHELGLVLRPSRLTTSASSLTRGRVRGRGNDRHRPGARVCRTAGETPATDSRSCHHSRGEACGGGCHP